MSEKGVYPMFRTSQKGRFSGTYGVLGGRSPPASVGCYSLLLKDKGAKIYAKIRIRSR